MTRTGRATVRLVGLNTVEGLAFVRIGTGNETRVRWRHLAGRVRWRCDRDPDAQDCTHTRAVTRHLAGAAMKETPPDE